MNEKKNNDAKLNDDDLKQVSGGAGNNNSYFDYGPYYIKPDLCNSCGACEPVCPATCISERPNSFVIDEDRCTSCGICEGFCPTGAIEERRA